MAASDSILDYAHLLKEKILVKYPFAEIQIKGGATLFEGNYDSLDFDQHFKELQDFRCDLLILNIGENIKDEEVYARNFQLHLEHFVSGIIKGDTTAEVILVGPFWKRENVRDIMLKVSTNQDFQFVDLVDMNTDFQYTAEGLFENPSVASHPGDFGMLSMADRIWKKIDILYQ